MGSGNQSALSSGRYLVLIIWQLVLVIQQLVFRTYTESVCLFSPSYWIYFWPFEALDNTLFKRKGGVRKYEKQSHSVADAELLLGYFGRTSGLIKNRFNTVFQGWWVLCDIQHEKSGVEKIEKMYSRSVADAGVLSKAGTECGNLFRHLKDNQSFRGCSSFFFASDNLKKNTFSIPALRSWALKKCKL